MKALLPGLFCVLLAWPAHGNPCADRLRQCLQENQGWYDGCAQRINQLSRAQHAQGTAELRPLCEQVRRRFDGVCRATLDRCEAVRVAELKRLGEQR